MTILRYSALCAAFLLASCASDGPSLGGIGGSGNYAEGSGLAAEMTGRDEAALAQTFVSAVEKGAPGQASVWSSGQFAGAVTPGAYLVGNLKPAGIMLPVAAPLTLNESFETELGNYALTGKANLRAGPSTEARVLGQFESGTGVDVVGKVAGKPWMLVATGGEVRGFVHESLMIRAPGEDDLTLAGGPTRTPTLCRAFNQRLTLFGRTDRWSGIACKDGGEWRLEGPAQVASTGP